MHSSYPLGSFARMAARTALIASRRSAGSSFKYSWTVLELLCIIQLVFRLNGEYNESRYNPRQIHAIPKSSCETLVRMSERRAIAKRVSLRIDSGRVRRGSDSQRGEQEPAFVRLRRGRQEREQERE